jgi:hypothetical protein
MCTLIHAASNDARQAFLRNINLNPKSPQYRRLYSHFLLNVANDEEGAKRQLGRAVELEGEEDNRKSLTSSTNCIIIIGGESDNMGQILEVNDRTCEVFETSWDDMTGKVINAFMARPFSPLHNSYLKHYIECKPTGVTGAAKKGIILKNAAGFILEADLQVREYANFTLEPSITFFGVLQPFPMSMFCLVKRSDLIIYDMSKLFFQFFSPDSQKLRSYELSITEHLPLFKVWQPQIDDGIGRGDDCSFEASIDKGGQRTAFVVHISPLQHLAKEYYHVMVELVEKDGQQNQQQQKQQHHAAPDTIREEPHLRKKKSMTFEDSDDSDTSSDTESDDETASHPVNQLKEQKEEISVASTARSGQLLRMSLGRNGVSFDVSLKYLLYSVVLLLTGLSALGICIQVLWSELTINRYEATLNLLTSPIQVGAVTATYSALLFQHIMDGTLFESEQERLEEEARINEDLSGYRDEMDMFRAHFFSELQYFTEEEVSKVKNAHVMMYSHEMKALNMTLMEAVHQYTGSMSLIVKRNVSELKNDPLPMRFVIANKDANVPQVWEDVCDAILQKQVKNNEFVKLLELYFSIAAIVSVVMAALLLFFPIVYRNNHQCAEIFSMFARIEMGNKKDVYGQCVQRLEDLDNTESSTNSLELQDLMEVIASKKTASKVWTSAIGYM